VRVERVGGGGRVRRGGGGVGGEFGTEYASWLLWKN